jgi:hypothetical protein
MTGSILYSYYQWVIDSNGDSYILVSRIKGGEGMKIAVKRILRTEKGAAMVLALILLLVGGLFSAPLLSYMGTGLLEGEVYENRTDQLYAADAGVEDAIWNIDNEVPEVTGLSYCYPDWSYNMSDVNGKSLEITITWVNNLTYRVVSTATGDNNSHTQVESYVYYGSEWRDLLDFGVVALNGDIIISGSSELDSYPEGNNTRIYANGNIDIQGSSKVYGEAVATGTITYKPGAITPGPITENLFPPLEFYLPDLSLYLAEANTGEFIDGDLDVTTNCTIGPAYITGDLYLASQAVLTLEGAVWVEGRIITEGGSQMLGEGPLVAVSYVDIKGSAAPAPEVMPVVISSESYIAVAGDSDSYMVVYAPNGKVSVAGTGAVNGAIIGKEIDISISKTCKLLYDSDVIEAVRAKKLIILTWDFSQQ